MLYIKARKMLHIVKILLILARGHLVIVGLYNFFLPPARQCFLCVPLVPQYNGFLPGR